MNQACVFNLVLLAGLVAPVSLQADPEGEARDEIWVDGPNDIKLGPDPFNPDAAVDFRGREIYVWDDGTYSPGTQAHNIVLRVLDNDGQTLVGPVQINTYDDSAQRYPRVAVSADGSFLVVWESLENSTTIIRSQTFDPDAQASGNEQILSNIPTGKPGGVFLDVAALTGGGYVAVWQSGAAGADTGTNIQGRRVGADGVPLDSQFQVSTISSDFESHACVTALADGGFVAAWSYTEVWGRRFMTDGTPLGDRFQVNTTTNGNETDVDIVTNADGRVAIVWRDGGDTANPVSTGIRGRLYSSTLTSLGNDFRINELTAGYQGVPSVADYSGNGFFVVWESETSAANDNAPNSIEGRIVTGNGQFGSAEFQVNQWFEKSQKFPAVGGAGGHVASAWFSQGTQDFTNTLVIKGRSWLICGIFCDGYE